MPRLSNAELVRRALNVIREAKPEPTATFTQADITMEFCQLRIANIHQERFLVLFLDSQHGLIKDEVMFKGTIGQAAVYPREIIRRALELGAAALIISHNHPSGVPEPSQADIQITQRIKDACNLFDITLLDHIIVSTGRSASFAQRGLL